MRSDCQKCEGDGRVELDEDEDGFPYKPPRISECFDCDGTGQGPERCDVCQDADGVPLPGTNVCQGCLSVLREEAAERLAFARELEDFLKALLEKKNPVPHGALRLGEWKYAGWRR